MSLFDTGIRPVVDKWLADKAAEKRDYGDYWSASSAGYCMKLNLMKRLGVPPVPEIVEDAARTTRVFTSGHLFHEWMQRITKEAGLSIAQELELQDEELMIRGHIDDLVLIERPIEIDEHVLVKGKISPEKINEAITKAQQHLILYDYKTANSRSFDYKHDEMNHTHKMQLGTYMYMLRKQRPDGISGSAEKPEVQLRNLTEARILTIEKDTVRMREQALMWSPELEKEVVGYWRTLNGYWKAKTLPKCTCLDRDGGFMGKRSKAGKIYNPFYYNDEPCSTEWYLKWKKEKK